jgi:hypothetical protein
MSNPKRRPRIRRYKGPAGGYGSLKSVSETLVREQVPLEGADVTARQNKPDGTVKTNALGGRFHVLLGRSAT